MSCPLEVCAPPPLLRFLHQRLKLMSPFRSPRTCRLFLAPNTISYPLNKILVRYNKTITPSKLTIGMEFKVIVLLAFPRVASKLLLRRSKYLELYGNR